MCLIDRFLSIFPMFKWTSLLIVFWSLLLHLCSSFCVPTSSYIQTKTLWIMDRITYFNSTVWSVALILGRKNVHRATQTWCKEQRETSLSSTLENHQNSCVHWAPFCSYLKQLGHVCHHENDANLPKQHSSHFTENSERFF